MSKELEALEVLKGIDIIIDGCAWNYKDTDYKEAFDILTKALERAKKEHELLGLYKELSFIRKFEYKKQQPSDTEIMCMNEIQSLEEKLK